MPYALTPQIKKQKAPAFHKLWRPVVKIFPNVPPLNSRGDRPLQMDFEQQLKALVFFHLEEHKSGRHLLQVLQDDDFARQEIAPPDGIKKSAFFEAINSRGLEQMVYMFAELQVEAQKSLAIWLLLTVP